MKLLVFAISSFIGIFSLITFQSYLNLYNDTAFARTIVFLTIASIDLIYIFAFKNLNKPIKSVKMIFNNKFLILGVLYGFVLIFIGMYFPPVSKILETSNINILHWIYVLSTGVAVTALIEISKFIRKNKTE